jgi:hypothetical protein
VAPPLQILRRRESVCGVQVRRLPLLRAEEGEDPLFLETVAGSKKEAADKARAEAAQAIAAVNELMAREAAATTLLIILDD